MRTMLIIAAGVTALSLQTPLAAAQDVGVATAAEGRLGLGLDLGANIGTDASGGSGLSLGLGPLGLQLGAGSRADANLGANTQGGWAGRADGGTVVHGAQQTVGQVFGGLEAVGRAANPSTLRLFGTTQADVAAGAGIR